MNRTEGPKQQSFVKGATILALAGLICKFIGAAYRIPLSNILGAGGMAYYQIAYPIYNFLLVVSSTGLPTAISKLVAGQVAAGNAGGAKRVFNVAFWLLLGIGIITSSALLLGSETLSNLWLGNSRGQWALMSIAPSLLLVSLISAYRGYFQGQQRMTPTAVSQVVEQVGKLLVGFSLAGYFMKYGIEYAAAGALIGVTLSEAIALLFIIFVYIIKGKPQVAVSRERRNRQRWEELPAMKESRRPLSRSERSRQKKESRKYGEDGNVDSPGSLAGASFGTVVGRILSIAIPVTIGASIMPLVNMVDSAMVINRLVAGGMPPEISRELFGVLSGYVQALINMPAVLTSALAMSLVPAISSAIASNRTAEVHSASQQGVRITWLIGLPAVVGLMMLAGPIMELLYPALGSHYVLRQTGSQFSASGTAIAMAIRALNPNMDIPAFILTSAPVTMLSIAGQLLSTMAVAVLFLSLVQTSTGILQGLGKPFVPVCALLIGAVFKVVVNYILVGMPQINIQGAPIGSILCYVIAATINLTFIIKSGKVKVGMLRAFMPLVIPTVLMGAVIYFENRFLLSTGGSRIITIAAIMVAAAVYGVMTIMTGAITAQDLRRVPGGRRIAGILSNKRGRSA